MRQSNTAVAGLPVVAPSGEKLFLAVTLDLNWFQRLSRVIGERTGANVLLLDGKGAILARHPKVDLSAPDGAAAFSPSLLAFPHAQGKFEAAGSDGRDALWGYVRIAGTGLRLAVSIDKAVALASHRKGVLQAVATFSLVIVLMTGLIWFAGERLFVRSIRELDGLLSLTLENVSQGIIAVDKYGTLPICNTRALDLLGLPRQFMASRPTADAVLAYQEKHGEFASLSENERRCLHPDFAASGRQVYERVRPNGVVLEICSVPMPDGGVVRTYTDITERKKAHEQLEQLANNDGLTGLANRRCFDETLEAEVKRAQRSHAELCLILIDVDHFKRFNDRYGHLEGDQCLRAVAQAVRQTVKRGTDCVARYGGEEFAILLPAIDLEAGLLIAERVRQAVLACDISHADSPHGVVSVSVGVSSLAGAPQLSANALIASADGALYAAKAEGRNRVSCVAPVVELSAAS